MEIKEAKKCKDCKGYGTVSTDYIDADHNIQRGAGDDVNCDNCNGSGEEPDEEIVVERIIENLTKEQEEKLQRYMIDNYGGEMGVCKDNCEDLFETWLGKLLLSDLEKILA